MALTSVCCLGTTAPWMQTGNGAQGFRDMGSCCQQPQSQVGWADLRLGRGLLGSAGSRAIWIEVAQVCLCQGPQAWRHPILCV